MPVPEPDLMLREAICWQIAIYLESEKRREQASHGSCIAVRLLCDCLLLS